MRPIVVIVISIILSACASTQSESLVSSDSRTGTYRQLKQDAHKQPLYYPTGFYSHDEQARYRTAKAWWNQ